MVNMNGRSRDVERAQFFEEQLFEAKQALFAARTVKEIRFLQNKINYLKQKVKELK